MRTGGLNNGDVTQSQYFRRIHVLILMPDYHEGNRRMAKNTDRMIYKLLKRLGEDVEENPAGKLDNVYRLMRKMRKLEEDGGDVDAVRSHLQVEPIMYSISPLPGRVPIVE